jgi:hypothetical protein
MKWIFQKDQYEGSNGVFKSLWGLSCITLLRSKNDKGGYQKMVIQASKGIGFGLWGNLP